MPSWCEAIVPRIVLLVVAASALGHKLRWNHSFGSLPQPLVIGAVVCRTHLTADSVEEALHDSLRALAVGRGSSSGGSFFIDYLVEEALTLSLSLSTYVSKQFGTLKVVIVFTSCFREQVIGVHSVAKFVIFIVYAASLSRVRRNLAQSIVIRCLLAGMLILLFRFL